MPGPDFMQLETSILQAVVDRRWDALADLLEDSFVITTAGWLAAATKEQWVDEVAQRHILNRFEIHSIEVRDMQGVSVVLVASTQWAIWKDSPFVGDFRYTDVWRRDRRDRWRLAVRHASLVPPG